MIQIDKKETDFWAKNIACDWFESLSRFSDWFDWENFYDPRDHQKFGSLLSKDWNFVFLLVSKQKHK